MELDLHSFLDSSSPSTDDDDDRPHRTIDEILNDCGTSSSSSSPPSSPSHTLFPHLNPLPHKPTQLLENAVPPRPFSFSRVKSADSSDDPFRSRVSRPFSSLLGGVRSNAKPGAALAAAAAASRSVPTPHAAAIKSRRKVYDAGSAEFDHWWCWWW